MPGSEGIRKKRRKRWATVKCVEQYSKEFIFECINYYCNDDAFVVESESDWNVLATIIWKIVFFLQIMFYIIHYAVFYVTPK